MTIKSVASCEAYRAIEGGRDAVLVDVRTMEEWSKVGVPHLSREKIVFCSWLGPARAQEFEAQFLDKIQSKMICLYFLCRAGVRSLVAANFVLSKGYKNCYNIVDGFEGNVENIGWKHNNLPWRIFSE